MKVETWTRCKHCGGEYGLHHSITDQCPFGGREAPIGQQQIWKSQTFEPEIEENFYTDTKIHEGQVYITPVLCADGKWRWVVTTFSDIQKSTPAYLSHDDPSVLFNATDGVVNPENYEE